MTPERATALHWKMSSMFPRPDDTTPPITAEERAEVTKVWRKMPGYTCFMDALGKIANGTDTEIVCDCCKGLGRIYNAGEFISCPACTAP